MRIRVRCRSLLSLTLFLAIAGMVSASPAGASPVGLDSSFGTNGNGTVLTLIGNATDYGLSAANAIVPQSDNKLVVGGTARFGRNNRFAVARYNPDGSLDTSFNTPNGFNSTQFGNVDGSNEQITSMAVLHGGPNDGKIITAGYATSTTEFALARYNADGTLDSTYFNPAGGGDPQITGPAANPPGTVETNVGGANKAAANALVVQGNKVVLGGFANPRSSATGEIDFALARYNMAIPANTKSVGSQTFPQQPGVTFTFNVQSTAGFPVPASGSTGSFLVGGQVVTYTGVTATSFTGCSATSSVTISDGTLVVDGTTPIDQSFGASGGTPGEVITPIPNTTTSTINTLALDQSGMVVAAGSAADSSHPQVKQYFALARYKDDGSLDPSFGSGGTVVTPVGSDQFANATSVLMQGSKILVAGEASDGGVAKFALARYNSNGSLDTTFGGGTGMVLTPIGSDNAAVAKSLAAQDTGFLVGGVASDGGVAKFALARYNSDGSLDTSFNSTGIEPGTVVAAVGDATCSIQFTGPPCASANGVVAPAGGDNIVAAGWAQDQGARKIALARFTDLPEPQTPGPPPPPGPPAVCFPRLGVMVCPGATLPSQTSLRVAAPCSLKASSVRMSHSGSVKVRLTCSAAASGTLKLTASGRSAKKSFSIAKGKTKSVALKLSSKARKTLKKKHRLRAKATLTFKSTGGAATAASVSRTITIKG